jgi:hypothetical protein
MTGRQLRCCDIKLVNWEEGNHRVTDRPYPTMKVILADPMLKSDTSNNWKKTKEEFYEENG